MNYMYIIITIDLIKRHFLARVKLIALYKQLDKNHIYIHFDKQNIKYSIYPKHNHLKTNNKYSYIHTHIYTRKHTCA